MNHEPNELVTLEWLIAPLNEKLDGLHSQADNLLAQMSHIATEYQAMSGVLTMANLPKFADLARLIRAFALQIDKSQDTTHIAKVLFASKLLQHEINYCAMTDLVRQRALDLKILYLQQLLATLGEEVSLSGQYQAFDGSQTFSEQISHTPNAPQTTPELETLLEQWHVLVSNLHDDGDNASEHLGELKPLCEQLIGLHADDNWQKLWYVVALWLDGMRDGQKVSFATAELLSELGDKTLWANDGQGLLLENLLVDVYVQLADLSSPNDDIKAVLGDIEGNVSDDKAFFPYVLSVLEKLIYGLSEGDINRGVLEELCKRLVNRGWSFYASYMEQIVADVASVDDNPESLSQLQWQLSTQLQDLYVMMSDAYQAITSKVGAVVTPEDAQNKDALREVRVLVEDIKTGFTEYLYSKNIDDLPAFDGFERLSFNFEEMGLPQATEISKKISGLFELLHANAPERISWQLSYKIADALSLFEMFLDNLAQEILDEPTLHKVAEYLDEAVVLFDQMDDETLEISDVDAKLHEQHQFVTVYDDAGEYEPAVSEPQNEAETTANKADEAETTRKVLTPSQAQAPTEQALSEAYLAVKAGLKDDDLSHDEEFREIFIEEAGEVMEEMLANLPKWQENINDLTILKEIRRNFHTLKGSGRMVGALQLGETAWAIENMLNRVLDNTIASSADVATLISDMADMVPVMVQDFAQGQPPSVDNASIVLRASNILAGKDAFDGVPSADMLMATSSTSTEEAEETEEVIETLTADETATASEDGMPSVLLPFIEQASEPPSSAIDDVDEDIKEIFIEEAGEVLEEITPKFLQWQIDHSQALLTDIRRGFHTLKGSGRMVGATVLGELAWSVENMFNRVLDSTISVNDGIEALVHDVLKAFSGLVAIFESGSDDYPAEVVLWTACAHAYSRGLGEEFDYRHVSYSGTATTATTPEPVATTPSDDKALNSLKEAEALILESTPQNAQDAEEDRLCQLFVEEAKELLDTIKQFLAQNQDATEAPVRDEVVRAFHTLRGASGLSPFVSIGEVSSMIEHSLQGLQRHESMMTANHLQILGNAVELIETHINAYQGIAESTDQDLQEGTQTLEQGLETLLEHDGDDEQDIAMLIDGVDALLDAELELEEVAGKDAEEISLYAQIQLHDIEILSVRTAELPKFQSLLATLKPAYELLSEHPEQAQDDGFIDALLAVHHELIGLFDSLAGSMSLRVDKAVLSRLSDITAEREVYYAELGKTLKEEHHADHVEEQAPTAIRKEVVNTDDELLQIFLEEAIELDATVTSTFDEWRAKTDDLDLLKALQRHLHTIKGGARLAGIASIGDLTHEAESVYESFVDGRVAVNGEWITTMQRVQDILSLQLDMVKNTKQSFFADETIEDLRHYLELGEVPSGKAIRVPVFEDKTKKAEPTPVEPEEQDEGKQFETFIADSWGGTLPDDDILAVFLDEAKELAESSREDFAAFRNNTSDIASLQSLQRKLHTIKGGARMVSANGMADLAHEMETVYENLGSRRRPATRMVANLLFACHDWISTAVELLADKYNPSRPTLLIDTLQQFIHNPDSLSVVPVVSLEKEAQVVANYKAYQESNRNTRDISRMPPIKGVFGESVETSTNTEMIRVSASLMERMINLSGEAAINRARIDMNMASLTSSIEEMGVTVQRLADQLRRMDNELEEQILAQIDDSAMMDIGFDPLEMDQYSSLNQLSKSLSESASDLLDIKATLLEKTRDGENLLLQLSRTQTELQDSLMNSRMVPFSRLTPRLQRIVRQTAGELGKNVDLTVINTDGEMDRSILEHITSPLEHMLRNAVDHGIESPDRRAELGKPYMGHITLEIQREGGEMIILLSDDGAGVNVEAVRKKAISQGLIHEDDELSDNDIMQYIFNAGLSTTHKVTQISGRGVGMDVVRTEIRQLGGAVSVESEYGHGSRFIIRVPLTVAVSDALIVRVADRQYAVPLVQIERVVQVNAGKLLAYHQAGDLNIDIDGKDYRLRYLNEILSGHHFNEIVSSISLPVIIVKTPTGQSLALQVDEIVGSRIEVVIKPLGRQLSRLAGISAATIMGDGSVMLILDLLALMRMPQARIAKKTDIKSANRRNLIMVVDDSVTVRKVTSRFLERQGFDVVVAKDGIDAVEILQDTLPDLMLLDIEMPRMDGFEVATQVRHNERLKDLPIIMITSRTGEKHRERAFEIGVNEYMGKPFQELDLLSNINKLLGLTGGAE